jgi:hypothetical protein
VIAFFFSGRLRVITRVAPSSVTMRCPGMGIYPWQYEPVVTPLAIL